MPPVPTRRRATPECDRFDWDWKTSDSNITDRNFQEMQQKVRDGIEDIQRDLAQHIGVGKHSEKLDRLQKKIDEYKRNVEKRLSEGIEVEIADSNLDILEETVEARKMAFRNLPSETLDLDKLAMVANIVQLVDKINEFKKANGITEMTSAYDDDDKVE